MSVINDGLDFVFFGVFDKVRRWPRVIDPVFDCFAIRSQEGCVKDIMNGPGCGELQLIRNGRYSFDNGERSMMFGGEFGRLIREGEMLRFEPDLVSYLIGVRWYGSCCLVQCFFCLLPFLRCLFSLIVNELNRGWWIREFHRDFGGVS